MRYCADVGTGGDDFIWRALASVGYSFDKMDLAPGYRYTLRAFDGSLRGPLDTLDVSGRFRGVSFDFLNLHRRMRPEGRGAAFCRHSSMGGPYTRSM